MRNLCLVVVALFFSINIHSQNVAYKIGGSGIISVSNSNYGILPGAGISLDNRIEFRGSQFEIKNSIGIETIPNINSTISNHTLVKLGTTGEYNFFRFGYINRFGREWTPYAGLGINAIYYKTGMIDDTETVSNNNTVYIEGITFSVRSSIGIKFKIAKRLILNAETSLEWGGQDHTKGRSFVNAGNNYSVVTSFGATYSLNK
jgi:hypothetical protein